MELSLQKYRPRANLKKNPNLLATGTIGHRYFKLEQQKQLKDQSTKEHQGMPLRCNCCFYAMSCHSPSKWVYNAR